MHPYILLRLVIIDSYWILKYLLTILMTKRIHISTYAHTYVGEQASTYVATSNTVFGNMNKISIYVSKNITYNINNINFCTRCD